MQQPVPPEKNSRFSLSEIIKFVGLFVLLGVVINRLDVQTVTDNWTQPTLGTLLVLVMCFSMSMMLRIIKWGIQSHHLGFKFNWLHMTRTYLVGILLGLLTPFRVGEAYRLLAFEVPEDNKVAHHTYSIAALVLEKAYEGAILLTMMTLGVFISFQWVELGLLLALGATAVIAFLLLPIHVPAFLRRWTPKGILTHIIEPIERARDKLPIKIRLLMMCLIASAQLFGLAGGLQVFQQFGEINAVDFIMRMPVITLINAAPVTIAGIGIRELGSMEVFGALGYPKSSAAVAASVVFIGENVIPLIVLLPLEVHRLFAKHRSGLGGKSNA